MQKGAIELGKQVVTLLTQQQIFDMFSTQFEGCEIVKWWITTLH